MNSTQLKSKWTKCRGLSIWCYKDGKYVIEGFGGQYKCYHHEGKAQGTFLFSQPHLLMAMEAVDDLLRSLASM